jgi:hypothetical protein
LAAGLPAALLAAEPRLLPQIGCGFRTLTGHPCPFCGMTRALGALAEGRLAEALGTNPLAPLLLVVAAGIAAWAFVRPRTGRKLGRAAGAAAGVLVAANWLYLLAVSAD